MYHSLTGQKVSPLIDCEIPYLANLKAWNIYFPCYIFGNLKCCSQTSGSRLHRTRIKQSKDCCPTEKVLGEVLFWGQKKCVTSIIWCNILDEVPFPDEMLSWTSWTNVTLASWAMCLIWNTMHCRSGQDKWFMQWFVIIFQT